MTSVMLCFNLFITPKYMGVSMGEVMNLIPTLFLPFNLIKGFVNMGITLLIYKPITSALKRTGLLESPKTETDRKKSWYLSICSVLIIIVSLILVFFVFKGGFEIFTK